MHYCKHTIEYLLVATMCARPHSLLWSLFWANGHRKPKVLGNGTGREERSNPFPPRAAPGRDPASARVTLDTTLPKGGPPRSAELGLVLQAVGQVGFDKVEAEGRP